MGPLLLVQEVATTANNPQPSDFLSRKRGEQNAMLETHTYSLGILYHTLGATLVDVNPCKSVPLQACMLSASILPLN